MARTQITAADLMPMVEYGKIRREYRRKLVDVKRKRRAHIGPHVTLYFENYDTMWAQVHEMLFIERGGDEQVEGELSAYNPLIPQGAELVATVMFEIDDPLRRARVLGTLGGVEDHAFLRVGAETIRGVPEGDQERSREDGKASAVQFVRFAFTPSQVATFRSGDGDVVVGFDHPNYGHMAVMPFAVRQALARDFA